MAATRMIAAALAIFALAGCEAGETVRKINPFAKSSPYQEQCRRALAFLVAAESEMVRHSVENIDERERVDGARTVQAVTIVYIQQDVRRLFTCLYDPARTTAATAISYRGQPLPAARLDQVNAGAAQR